MKTMFYVAAAAAAIIATPAAAQDMSRANGAYVGVVAGVDNVRIDDGTDSGSSTGILYGVTAGYDALVGNVVLGIEGEWTDATTGESETDVFATGDALSLDASSDLYIGARLGYATPNGGVVYLKGGYTTGRIKLTYDDGTTTVSDSDNLGGYRIGAGYEMPFGKNMFGRIEYRYSDYGEYTYSGFATGLSTNRHQLAVTLGAKF